MTEVDLITFNSKEDQEKISLNEAQQNRKVIKDGNAPPRSKIQDFIGWGSAEETRGRKPGSKSKSGGYKVKKLQAKLNANGEIMRDSMGKPIYEDK